MEKPVSLIRRQFRRGGEGFDRWLFIDTWLGGKIPKKFTSFCLLGRVHRLREKLGQLKTRRFLVRSAFAGDTRIFHRLYVVTNFFGVTRGQLKCPGVGIAFQQWIDHLFSKIQSIRFNEQIGVILSVAISALRKCLNFLPQLKRFWTICFSRKTRRSA